jgi:hypothetical protein
MTRQTGWWLGWLYGGLLVGSLFAEERRLEPAPSPADNPLKGLVPYADPHPDRFPHSMEFGYLPFGKLMTGPETFDWRPLEKLLEDIAGRGNQTVFRIYLEYPGKDDGIPKFLIQGGLKVHRYLNTNTQPFPPQKVATPDYENPELRKALQTFVREFGRKYDNDPRIAYITAGLLGTWGEWHTYPREELFASPAVQREVLDAYAAAFRKTPVLLRYPTGPDEARLAENADRPFGYHDDSFAWATLDTGKPDDGWFYVTRLRASGQGAVDKWRRHPIGGEIRPELWGDIFDPEPKHPQAQDFGRCIEETHVTWLMDTGLFREPPTKVRRERAEAFVRRMGYDFVVRTAVFPATATTELPIVLHVINQGVAPFYRDWPLELGVVNAAGELAQQWPTDWSLCDIPPSETVTSWRTTQPLKELAAGKYELVLRVVNPLPNGKPLRFAKATQDAHLPGWLSLGALEIRP